MTDSGAQVIDRFRRASGEFQARLRAVRPAQQDWPTPCPDWDVRRLVSHMTQGNLNYRRLACGATAADFLRHRDAPAPPGPPLDAAFADSVTACAGAFAEPGAMDRILDYPLGRVPGRQALAVRTADTIVHTWDLARAVGAPDVLAPDLLGWLARHLDEIYAGLAETPADPASTHRFFAPPGRPASDPSEQDRLLLRFGRDPAWRPPAG